MTINAEQLLTVAGISGLVWLLLALFIKRFLRQSIGLPAESSPNEDPKLKARFSLWLNLVAFVLAEAFSFLATAVFVGMTSQDALQAFLTGLVGAASAVGISEVGSNVKKPR